MKTTLIRTLSIVVFATSISAFAQTSDTKRQDTVTTTFNTTQQNFPIIRQSDPGESNVSLKLDQLQEKVQQLEAKDKESQEQKQRTNQEQKKQIRQEEKEWEHSLLGIYGG